MSTAELAACDAWTSGWAFLDAGFFWEAHEVWEAVWLALPPNSAERRFAQAVIQLANALLKEKMDRPKAVRRLCDECRTRLSGAPAVVMRIEVQAVQERLGALEHRIATKRAL
jgi:predicted metal-dependent hydrolase